MSETAVSRQRRREVFKVLRALFCGVGGGDLFGDAAMLVCGRTEPRDDEAHQSGPICNRTPHEPEKFFFLQLTFVKFLT